MDNFGEAYADMFDKTLSAISNAGPSPNQNQITRLYSLATNKGWTHAGVKELIKMNYRRNSTKDLTISEYNEVCEFIDKSHASNVVAMKADPNTIDIFKEQHGNT